MELTNDLKGSLSVAQDFDLEGLTNSDSADVTLVVSLAEQADSYLTTNSWTTMWADTDKLYQSPRPFSTYNGSIVLEPNVQRFIVAKDTNSIVPQFKKGLFFNDPPFLLKPRGGTSTDIITAKTELVSYELTRMKLEREVGNGLHQMVLSGTGIYQWGLTYETVTRKKRKSQTANIPSGGDTSEIVYSDKEPELESIDVKVCTPTFEFVDLRNVFVDPKLEISDIREAGWVSRQRFVNFYDLQSLREDKTYAIPEDKELKEWFEPASMTGTPLSQVEQSTVQTGTVHHAQQQNIPSANPLADKKEMLEYWDRAQCITVIDRKHKIRKMDNPYKCIPFLSSVYYLRPKAFYGIGVGILAGGDQRVQQGVVNSALKLLNMKTNAPYMRQADSGIPTQTITTGLGRIITVQDIAKGYKIMETPDVPGDLWNVLQESKSASDSATGADQSLVQGSSSGPRSSMGRTAGGASILAGASATRLDGPLDEFINQVYVPYLNILDKLIHDHVSDKQIMEVLGKRLGKAFQLDLDAFHEAEVEYDVLAGARLSARAAMAQSLELLFQVFENPQIQTNLADINGQFVDFKPLLSLMLQVSQWGAGLEDDVFKPLTPEMKQQRAAAKSNPAQKLQQQLQLSSQKFDQKSQLQSQANDQRIQRDMVRDAVKSAGLGEVLNGQPNESGFGGSPLEVA